jgi:hypothetical protein
MKVTINGHEFNYPGSGSISVNGNNVVINGQTIDGEFVEGKNIDIHVEGSVSNIETTGSVSVNGNVNCVDAGGSVRISGDAIDINAGGSVHVGGQVHGDISAGGSVHCEEHKSPQTNDRQYYEKIIKDAYESEKGLETVEEGMRFTDALRALFGIKPYNRKGNGRI